jgi:hypothetical protein
VEGALRRWGDIGVDTAEAGLIGGASLGRRPLLAVCVACGVLCSGVTSAQAAASAVVPTTSASGESSTVITNYVSVPFPGGSLVQVAVAAREALGREAVSVAALEDVHESKRRANRPEDREYLQRGEESTSS